MPKQTIVQHSFKTVHKNVDILSNWFSISDTFMDDSIKNRVAIRPPTVKSVD